MAVKMERYRYHLYLCVKTKPGWTGSTMYIYTQTFTEIKWSAGHTMRFVWILSTQLSRRLTGQSTCWLASIQMPTTASARLIGHQQLSQVKPDNWYHPVILLSWLKQAVREAATICNWPLQVDLWPFDLESGVRVTCDVGYICANFSLPRPLCSRLRPDVRDRQTDRCQTDRHQTCIIDHSPYPRCGA